MAELKEDEGHLSKERKDLALYLYFIYFFSGIYILGLVFLVSPTSAPSSAPSSKDINTCVSIPHP
jgi:hypothetical protein